MITARDIWYGNVYCLHSNEVCRWMDTNRKSWENALCFVTRLKGVYPVNRDRQLSSFHKQTHSSNYYLSLKFFDELHHLSDMYDFLSKTASGMSNITVARTYFWQHSVSRTMTILASTAVRISRELLNTLWEIMNSEHPQLAKYSVNDRTDTSDCDHHVFRNFVKLHFFVNVHHLWM